MVGSVWTDISSMLGTSPIMKESTGYPTQKPQKLLEATHNFMLTRGRYCFRSLWDLAQHLETSSQFAIDTL